ncbi:MAG: D-alanyl-D-alanine carboxypeptidase/D-alanyl-D-alanine-endopeptidase [Myxococcales bacterium]|nr:D-alanyl-D-alanine carboxypeptidase/D-alanyl-D-alanine-endopeptidase [Myxococcales bacterium]
MARSRWLRPLAAGLVAASALLLPARASSEAAPKPGAIAAELARLAAGAEVKGFHVGVEAIEIDTGRVLVAAGEHQPLNPASNAKLVTAVATLVLLHPEHRFETGLYGPSGKGSVLSGPLVLRGFGDPSLRTGDLYAMALELKRDGVKRIDGGILVDQRFYDEAFAPPAFEQQPNEWMPFRAPVAAISLDENAVVATIRPGGGDHAIVSFWPPGFVEVEGTIKLNEGGGTNVQFALSAHPTDPSRMLAKVSGSIPASVKGVTYTRRVEDPRLLAGYALKAILQDMGIEVKGDVKAGAASAHTLLAKHKSAPVGALLLPVGKDSNNFYAETMMKVLGGEKKGKPATTANGAELATKLLEKIGAFDTGVVVKNGSGLFDANRATAHELATLLRWAWREPSIQPEMAAHLSVGGVDGTLHGRFKAEHARRAVRAKTGTLDDAVALSGYVLAPPGRSPVAFSILVNNCKGRVAQARGFADRIVAKIVHEVWGGT